MSEMFTKKEKKRFNRWFADKRREAIKTGFILGLHFFLGFLLGWFLFFGPLEVDNAIIQFLGGLLLGIINLSLAARQKIFSIIGRKKEAAQLATRLRLGRRGIIGALLLIIIVQLYLLGIFAPLRQASETNFNRMLRVLESNYAYEVDWDQLEEQYRPRFAEASFPDEFYPLAREFVAELNDPGTAIFSEHLPPEKRWLGLVRKIEGEPIVFWVRPGADYEGLEPGTRIIERDGQEISDFVQELPHHEVRAFTPHLEEYNRYSRVLTLEPEEEIELIYETPAGEIIETTVGWDEEYYAQNEEPELLVEELSDAAVLIEVKTFFTQLAPDLLNRFEEALNEYRDREYLILDLRENRGGSHYLAELLAGCFFEEEFHYGHEYYPSRLPHKAWRTSFSYDIQPREPHFAGEVFILTDTINIGTAELFLAALKDSGRAQLLGLTTGGTAGEALSARLSDGQINYSFGDFHRREGTPISGKGLEPHYEVEWQRDHLIEGVDPYREALQEILDLDLD